jgi:NAD(P)H-dependent FMN reductase
MKDYQPVERLSSWLEHAALMNEPPMKVLTLCGSLRAHSSNRAILHAYERLAPSTLKFEHFEKIGVLPHFNPDLDGECVPDEVAVFRSLVAGADVVAMSTPEYVHALPGAFKNALDWLVSDPAFVGKRVVIFHVSRGSTWVLDSLREVLKMMSANIIEAASVSLPLGSNQIDEEGILMRDDLRAILLRSVDALLKATIGKPS